MPADLVLLLNSIIATVSKNRLSSIVMMATLLMLGKLPFQTHVRSCPRWPCAVSKLHTSGVLPAQPSSFVPTMVQRVKCVERARS